MFRDDTDGGSPDDPDMWRSRERRRIGDGTYTSRPDDETIIAPSPFDDDGVATDQIDDDGDLDDIAVACSASS